MFDIWRKKSLIYPSIAFLLLAIFATLGVGYFINHSILNDVLQKRTTDQADQFTVGFQEDFSKKIDQLDHFKNSWLANTDWLLHNDVDSFTNIWADLKEIFPLWKIDFLLILDQKGELLHHLPDSFAAQKPIPDELFVNAMAAVDQGKHWLTMDSIDNQWNVLLFAPIGNLQSKSKKIVVFGYKLDRITSQRMQEQPGQHFILTAADGAVIHADTAVTGNEKPDKNLILKTIRSGQATLDFDTSREWNLYFTPIKVIDKTFCLIVPVRLDEIRDIMANSRKLLAASALFIVALLVLFSYGMDRLILAPLRQLRKRAAIMVKACSDNTQQLYLESDAHGNEIQMLEQAYEAASLKLYTHVSQLNNAKQLLEGLALQDPITLLGNLRMFNEFLGQALSQCRRKERKVAVMIIEPLEVHRNADSQTPDHDHAILLEIANRLKHHLRGEDLAFRYGDHDFIAFAPECGDAEQVMAWANRLHKHLLSPFELKQGNIEISIYIGISIFPNSGDEVETLVKRAEEALHEAKTENKGYFKIYAGPGMASYQDDD